MFSKDSAVPEFEIRPITAEEARKLRRAVLRPTQPPETIIYPLDDAPGTLHVGAFLGNELVGITTVSHEPPPGEQNLAAWRMRGVAVIENARGKGIGRMMAKACLDHVIQNGGKLVWVNGRTTALKFYNALGFQTRGQEFVTDTGPHYLVWRSLE